MKFSAQLLFSFHNLATKLGRSYFCLAHYADAYYFKLNPSKYKKGAINLHLCAKMIKEGEAGQRKNLNLKRRPSNNFRPQ